MPGGLSGGHYGAQAGHTINIPTSFRNGTVPYLDQDFNDSSLAGAPLIETPIRAAAPGSSQGKGAR